MRLWPTSIWWSSVTTIRLVCPMDAVRSVARQWLPNTSTVTTSYVVYALIYLLNRLPGKQFHHSSWSKWVRLLLARRLALRVDPGPKPRDQLTFKPQLNQSYLRGKPVVPRPMCTRVVCRGRRLIRRRPTESRHVFLTSSDVQRLPTTRLRARTA